MVKDKILKLTRIPTSQKHARTENTTLPPRWHAQLCSHTHLHLPTQNTSPHTHVFVCVFWCACELTVPPHSQVEARLLRSCRRGRTAGPPHTYNRQTDCNHQVWASWVTVTFSHVNMEEVCKVCAFWRCVFASMRVRKSARVRRCASSSVYVYAFSGAGMRAYRLSLMGVSFSRMKMFVRYSCGTWKSENRQVDCN